ncbi:transposable element Tcb1 transposase [Trichonephila clavipes]|nr:transposable element Tcb1 transposase [Trichonephila clavipes]
MSNIHTPKIYFSGKTAILSNCKFHFANLFLNFFQHVKGEYSYKCLSDIPTAITDSISLHERINLSFNCISTLPAELPLRIPHIAFLDLSYNKISALPDSIGLLFHLKCLLLSHNCLEEIPSTITRLVKLQKIDLSHNCLLELPEKIGEMESLRKLNVSNNKLKSLPKSLGSSETIEIILAISNCCISQPPQNICDSGSDSTIRFLKQLASGKILAKQERELNIFPRVRANVIQTAKPNSDSVRAQYVQIQTATLNTASRIRTPLLPPYDATQLHPDELRDKIIGILYGAIIGDALGTATEFLSRDECRFHYDEETFTYSDIIRDEHRAHWTRGDWTSNSDQMLLVLDSLLQWAGVVDELEFAKHLVSWKRSGIPELGPREIYMYSTTINLVLQADNYIHNPHQVAEDLHKNDGFGITNGTDNNNTIKSSLFVDSGSLPRSLVLAQERRLTWAREHSLWTIKDWEKVIFSDKSQFCIYGNQSSAYVRRRTHEEFRPQCLKPTVKYPTKVMVWGCMSSHGVGKLHIANETVKAMDYIEILQNKLLPTARDLLGNQSWIFQDDNTPCHRAKGKYSLDDPSAIEDLIKIAVQFGLGHCADESVKKEFTYYCRCSDYKNIGLSEVGKACHPFKACAAAFSALRRGKDFRSALTSLLMLGGYSSMTGCITGSLLGCKFGYSLLPREWIDGLNAKNKEWINGKINALLDMMGLP